MATELLGAYLAMDLRQAVAHGTAVPAVASGSVVLADISGFTPLTESLVDSLGPRRGAEELTRLLNTVYDGLVTRVHHFGGSIICFIGDALIGFFPGDTGVRGVACGLQMQRTMKGFQAIRGAQGGRVSLSMKAAVAAGPVRRFMLGDPDIQRLDVLVGATIDRLAEAERHAEQGKVIVSPEVARKIGRDLILEGWRGPYGVVQGLRGNVEPSPWPDLPPDRPTSEQLRPYLLRPVHERVGSGQGEFLAELRPISVLFLRFTGIEYEQDKTAGEKLNAFTTWVQRVVERFGGYVLLVTTADKGSHLYVVFGALEAHEDDPERAVAAAMALADRPSALGFIRSVQIGVSYGRARVGAYGGKTRRTYGALGDVVNLAARLMTAAPMEEIRCSEAVYEAARGRWAFEALPSVSLKGIDRPQVVYRPRGRAMADARDEMHGLVGRHSELATVEKLLLETQAGPRRILLIEGEAGIGKSRFVEEIQRMAGGRGFTCLAGAADSIERYAPYRAWRELFTRFFELSETMERSSRRDQVLERLEEIASDLVSRVGLLNDILELELPESPATRGYTPEVRQDSLAALVGELLSHRARSEPIVLIIEDAHWLDSLSWELVVSVARTLTQRPALLVLTHRPHGDVVPPAYTALAAMSGAEQLQLGALPPNETVLLAAARLQLEPAKLPEALVTLLTERAEGNPFFAVELIGALRDKGLLIVEGESCTVAGDVSELRESVPETLEGVVLSRLDGLPPEEQLTLKVASVIGRSFLVRTVRHAHPARTDTPELRAHLEHTSRRRLTVLEAEEPEPGYAFQHVFTQQVAYDTLLFEQRRELHRSVASWYEEAYAGRIDPHLPVLAFHWNRAEHGEKECVYCRLAGAQAAVRHANAEAEIYFSRALELIDELDRHGESERRYDVLRRRARILAVLGRVEEERGDLERLWAIAEAGGVCARRGEVLLLRSDAHKRCGRFGEAKEIAELALAAMNEAGDPIGRARALTHIGDALEGTGNFQEAREVVERALDVFRKAGDIGGQATSLKSLGIIAARLGQLPAAMERFLAARDLYRELGERKGEADILGNLGALNYYLGEYERCIEYTEQAQPLFHEMGNRIGSAKCLTNLGNSYSALGAFAEGLEHHQRALELYEQLEDANGRADSLCNIGLAHAALGVGGQLEFVFEARGQRDALQDASEATRKAMDLYATIGSRRGEAITSFNLGAMRLCMGDTEAAEAQLASALGTARESGLDRLVMRSLSALARMSFMAGDLDRAGRFSAEALGLLAEGSSPTAIEIHYTQFRILEARKLLDRALPHLETACRLIGRQGATIGDDAVRDRFLATYGEVLTSCEKHRATPPA